MGVYLLARNKKLKKIFIRNEEERVAAERREQERWDNLTEAERQAENAAIEAENERRRIRYQEMINDQERRKIDNERHKSISNSFTREEAAHKATTEINEQRRSRCIYCNAESYGSGCIYSESGKHVHPPGTKCIYCGADNVGVGCIHSPTGYHQKA